MLSGEMNIYKSRKSIIYMSTVIFKRLVTVHFSGNLIYFYINHPDCILEYQECPGWFQKDTGMLNDVRRTSGGCVATLADTAHLSPPQHHDGAGNE